jgi:glycosyltransferase involved in cell wall biosynthesis
MDDPSRLPQPPRRQPLRVLVVTKLFPNAAQPLAAPFSRQQYAALARRCRVDVMGLLPWFPGARLFRRWSAAGRLLDVPRYEVIDGVPVEHPRVLYVPKIGARVAPALFTASLLPRLLAWRDRVDVVVGSWAYPEGVASVIVARLLGLPVVVQLLGSDMNVIARQEGPRRILARVLPQADAVVGVSQPLVDAARALGVAADRSVVVPNGVDRTRFHPTDRLEARAALGRPDPHGRWIVFVGNLLDSKGIPELLEAFRRIAPAHPELKLAIVGGGPEAARCERAAADLPGRVLHAGARPHDEVPRWIAAADVMTLPSHREGMPNVVLEALASGRRVVATRVGGIPDVITSPVFGELVPAGDAGALAEALARAATTTYDPRAVVAGWPIDWDRSAELLHDVLLGAARARRAGAGAGPARGSPPAGSG